MATKTKGEKLAEEIRKTVFSVQQALRDLDAKKVLIKPQPDKWADIEILGHLIDSAVNNHQRIVRASIDAHIEAFGYKQNAWVENQKYIQRDWKMLLSVWVNLNFLLSCAVNELPDTKLHNTISIDGNEPITLQFMIEDYNAHLQHHLKQILADVF